ncbi:MAG: hypothetical protein MUC48_21810 [Leptolyngbya sp. Prado105]|jgi:hypothetical protein|nr:hypothetical protein [Leptolyngbya sp. Prado105]
MFKLISGLVAGVIVLAPMLPAQAGFGRSSGFGVTIGSPASFGVYRSIDRYPRGFHRRYSPRGRNVMIRDRRGYYSRDRDVMIRDRKSYFGSPRTRTVIVNPRVRTVIVNPGYRYDRRSNCGSVIYGSPIASPIPVDPYTGLACR